MHLEVGNIGFGGALHALMSPLATAMIDMMSYSGMDVRKTVHDNPTIFPPDASVLDLCCGTGFSTTRGAVGVDTSSCMLGMARFRRPDATFQEGNAETYGEPESFDIVSVMFATHEVRHSIPPSPIPRAVSSPPRRRALAPPLVQMPISGRQRVIRNAMRVARDAVVVVDIDPNFEETLRAKPNAGATFLAGGTRAPTPSSTQTQRASSS